MIIAYNEFLKPWVDDIKIESKEFGVSRQVIMSLSQKMKNVLGHIAEMSEANPAYGVYNTTIITESGISKREV